MNDIALLTLDQVKYWKDPEKRKACRAAYYAKHPDRVYASVSASRAKNKDHYNRLTAFYIKISKARKAGDEVKARLLSQAREEYKKAWRAANRPAMDEVTRIKYCECTRLKQRYRALIYYYKHKKYDLEKVKELELQRDKAIKDVMEK